MLPPFSVRLLLISKEGERISATAMVSPSARPSASIVPPMIPPRPKGSTTVRTMPQVVAPSASAASFSPGGVCEKTWRITAHAIGITIIDTAMPATKALKPYWLRAGQRRVGLPPGTSKIGSQPRFRSNQIESSAACGMSSR